MKVKLSMGTRVTDGRRRGKRRRIMGVGTQGKLMGDGRARGGRITGMGTRRTNGRRRGKRRRIMDVGTRGTDGMGQEEGE